MPHYNTYNIPRISRHHSDHSNHSDDDESEESHPQSLHSNAEQPQRPDGAPPHRSTAASNPPALGNIPEIRGINMRSGEDFRGYYGRNGGGSFGGDRLFAGSNSGGGGSYNGGRGGGNSSGRRGSRPVPWMYRADPEDRYRGSIRTVEGIERTSSGLMFRGMDYSDGEDEDWRPLSLRRGGRSGG